MNTKQTVTIEQAIAAGHDENDAPRVVALCEHLECIPEDVEPTTYDHYDMPIFSAEGGEYAVATDEEADAAWEQSLDNYIEECIQPELDKLTEGAGSIGNYVTFDRDMWIRDAKMDGRGHSLSNYDGNEEEVQVDGILYAIFRTN